jgi:hypothetical protein
MSAAPAAKPKDGMTSNVVTPLWFDRPRLEGPV